MCLSSRFCRIDSKRSVKSSVPILSKKTVLAISICSGPCALAISIWMPGRARSAPRTEFAISICSGRCALAISIWMPGGLFCPKKRNSISVSGADHVASPSVSGSPAVPDPPRASKPLLFLRILIKNRYFFDPRPTTTRPEPQNRYFS